MKNTENKIKKKHKNNYWKNVEQPHESMTWYNHAEKLVGSSKVKHRNVLWLSSFSQSFI